MRFHSRGPATAMCAVAGVVLALCVLFVGPDHEAQARSQRVKDLVALCNSGVGVNRKSMAMDELCDLDTSEAREALEELADSADDKTATLALAAIGRENYSGAKTKLEAVFESSRRSDVARCAALGAICRLEEAADKDWSDIESYVDGHCGTNTAPCAMSDAIEDAVFGGGGGE